MLSVFFLFLLVFLLIFLQAGFVGGGEGERLRGRGRLIAALLLSPFASSPAAEKTRNALIGAEFLQTALAPTAKQRVEFIGAKSFTDVELTAAVAEQIREINENGLTPARADDTAYYLGAFYRKKGFASVEVDCEIRGGKAALKIQEGPRSLLRGVTFTGNKSLPDATLWEYFLGATPERLAKEPEKFPYNAAEVASGADRVRGLYISEGYLDAVVDAAKIDLTENGTRASVTVRIEERQRYLFGDVQFHGETRFKREELVKAMIEPVDGPFSATKVTNAERNIQSFLKAHGYYQAEVAVAADPAKAVRGRVAVRFDVKPGHLFHFDGVTATGTDRLRADFLPKRFAHLKGEKYDPEMLDETFREMLRTGLFKNLRPSLTPVGKDELRIDLTVEEAKAREVGATIGAGSYEGASIGVRLADRNLFGRGRPLSLAVDYSLRGLRGELLYVDPWLFDTRFSLRSRLYSAARDEEGYSKNQIGWRFDLTRKLLPHLEAGLFVEQQSVTLTSAGIDLGQLGPTDYFLTSVGLTASIDYRDNPINPSRGFIFTNAADFSTLDGEPAFTRYTVRFSYYLPVKKFLFAFGARSGLIAPITDRADIPIDVRYFNGGGTTVRSFAERELGSQSRSGDPLGGEFFTIFNAEMTFPLIRNLQGAAFVDAGNLTSSDEIGLGDMRYAVGLGLRYKLPIGPLRLDYGVNPSPQANEARGAFHFSFGFAF